MNSTIETLQNLVKALEAGGYNGTPSSLTQGSALQVENLSPVMHVTTFDDKHIKLQKMIGSSSCKSTLAQFDRQLSYGHFGGSAQLEGNVGFEATSDFARIVVPMCFYSHTRRVTLASTMVDTVDSVKSDDRAAQSAAKKIAADLEFDLIRGRADFSNAGVFDGNPLAMPSVMPNIIGLDVHIRQSDSQSNAQDLMFNEYGSDQSVVLPVGGALTQDAVEDASVRSAMNMGQADKLLVDPIVLSNYNKIVFGKERIVLAGSPQEATGADLRKQWVSGGTVDVEASRFLSGKTSPQRARPESPLAPTTVTAARSAAGDGTPFRADEVYKYAVTTCNEAGESQVTAASDLTIVANGDRVTLTITHASTVSRYFNVYRSAANGTQRKFIGRVQTASGATTSFVDLGNRSPGFVTGILVEADAMEQRELAPYSRLKLAVADLSIPEAHFAFRTLQCTMPRHMVLLDNLR